MIMQPRTSIECDWCGVRQPEMWVVHHAKFIFLQAEADPRASIIYDIKDGDMATCDGCLPFVDRKDAASLSARAIAHLSPSPGAARLLTHYHREAIARLLPERELRKANEQRIGPNFYEYKCPSCGHANTIDNASYGRSVQFPCAVCGLDQIVVGHPRTEAMS